MSEPHEQYKPIATSDAIHTEAIDRYFALAEVGYDPTGMFYQGREVSRGFSLRRDTQGLKIPAIYQAAGAQLTVLAFSKDRTQEIGVSVTIGTPDGSKDTYSMHEEKEVPMVAALLGEIACVDLEQFRIDQISSMESIRQKFDPRQYTFNSRERVQKTYDPEGTETNAIHASLFRIGELNNEEFFKGYAVCLVRPFIVGGSPFVYRQTVKSDKSDPTTFLQAAHVIAMLKGSPALGAQYVDLLQGEEVPSDYIEELEDFARDGGSLYVGNMTGQDVSRIISEPLNSSHRLRIAG